MTAIGTQNVIMDRSDLLEIELATLFRVSQVLSRPCPLWETLDQVLRILHEYGELHRGVVSLVDPDSGALLVSVPGFALIRRHRPDACAAPAYQHVDTRLLAGSALFGIGWGIAGYCPGPALANLAHAGEAIAFVGAMLAGSQLARLLPSPT